MGWKTGSELLDHARANGYAVGAFSAHNAETIQGILWAAEEMSSPVMIQVGQRAIPYMGIRNMRRMIASFVEDIHVPVCVHLDHGRSFEQAAEAVQSMYQSVMYDGSALPLEENISQTLRVVEMAHAAGVSVEGELGRIGGTEDHMTVEESDASLTDTEEATTFARSTGVDYLAVSVGTAHGLYTAEPTIRFDRLQEIAERVPLPIVLHGGSGVPDHMIEAALPLGISKINVDTELRVAFQEGVLAVWEDGSAHLSEALGEGRSRVQEKVREKIRLFGSSGKNLD